ncbi:MAG TPA: ROK family protein [Nocardioidaceae bacterium]|nr:ROK family protein [Nocardioidaceae bacterium]
MDPNVGPGILSHGELLDLLRREGPRTRRDLLHVTHLSRSTLVERVTTLQRLGLLREGQRGPVGAGRPPVLLEVDDTSHTTLAIDLGAVHATVAVTDLSAQLLRTQHLETDLSGDPMQLLRRLRRSAARLVAQCGGPARLLGVGLGFPGLAGREPGTIEAPAVYGHWDGVPAGRVLARGFGVPALVVNDAHALAYAEHLAHDRARTLLAVKVATGIGAGLVIDGRLHGGDSNGAGQLGHMRVPGLTGRCSCGQRGCLATIASGRALVAKLRRYGVDSLDAIVEASGRGHPRTVAALREAGEAVGAALSGVATMVDPGALLVGGTLGVLQPFQDGVRTMLHDLTYARTARGIHIGPTRLGERATVTGVAALIIDQELSPGAVDRLVAARGELSPDQPARRSGALG